MNDWKWLTPEAYAAALKVWDEPLEEPLRDFPEFLCPSCDNGKLILHGDDMTNLYIKCQECNERIITSSLS